MRSLLFGRNERANVYGLLQKPVEMQCNAMQLHFPLGPHIDVDEAANAAIV